MKWIMKLVRFYIADYKQWLSMHEMELHFADPFFDTVVCNDDGSMRSMTKFEIIRHKLYVRFVPELIKFDWQRTKEELLAIRCHYLGHDVTEDGYCNGDSAESSWECNRCGRSWHHVWY